VLATTVAVTPVSAVTLLIAVALARAEAEASTVETPSSADAVTAMPFINIVLAVIAVLLTPAVPVVDAENVPPSAEVLALVIESIETVELMSGPT
jgi:hypothetical protein